MDPSAARRFGSVTPREVAALDAAAAALGIDVVRVMEVAGFQVARLAWRMVGSRPRGVHVVAGHGNNGGDALVAARHLAAWGCTVTAAVVRDPGRVGALLESQCAAARGAGVEVTVSGSPDRAAAPDGAALVIDGLLGTGLTEPPRHPAAAVIDAMRGRILSVDVPSGFDAAEGIAVGTAVAAAATCTLAACKRGFWVEGASRWTGTVWVADIGMPQAAWSRCGMPAPSAVRGGALRRVPLGAAGIS
jgi:NAD(P)H-hydrate epimerase